MKKLSIKELSKKRKKKGFTLIELIIVIAIIAILAAMAIPKFGEIRNSANSKTDVATAKNIATSIAAEIANNNTTYTSDKSDTAVEPDLLAKLDGDTKPKVSGHTAFHYTISDGNIIISYENGDQVYPQSDAE